MIFRCVLNKNKHLVSINWEQLYHSCTTAKHVHKVIKDIQQGSETLVTTSEIMMRVIQMVFSSQESNYLFYNNPLKNFNNGRSDIGL